MTTTLERAARAAALANEDEGCLDAVVAYAPIARAVLLAVRNDSGVHDHEDGRANFAAMIDAILGEGG